MSLMRLSELAKYSSATVAYVISTIETDAVSARLRDLGFVNGEPVRITATGPFGGAPLLIHIGNTRFALRRQEADLVVVLKDYDHV